MTPVNTKLIGPYRLTIFPSIEIIFFRPLDDGEAGGMPLEQFEREVCPWDELGEGMDEMVRDFYGRNF